MSTSEDKPKLLYKVYRKRWYGESLFVVCEEIVSVNGEEAIFLRNDGQTIAILPKKDFSCAISMIS